MIDVYSEDLIKIFLEIAKGAYNPGKNEVIHKWNQDIYLQVRGYPSKEDIDVKRRHWCKVSSEV
jgi:hypothetical protein